MKKIFAWLFLLLLFGSASVYAQTNLDFEQGLKGWTTYGNAGFAADTTQPRHGKYCARIGRGDGTLLQRIPVKPLSIIQFNGYIKSAHKGFTASSFINFHNNRHQLLLAYKSKIADTTGWQQTGNYTETPPGTSYAEIGITKTASANDIYLDDFSIETNIGEPKIKHQPLCDLDEYMRPFWLSDTVYNETVLLFSANGKPAEGRLLYGPSKNIIRKKV